MLAALLICLAVPQDLAAPVSLTEDAPGVLVTSLDGTTLSGELEPLEGARLSLRVPGFLDPLELGLDELLRVDWTSAEDAPLPDEGLFQLVLSNGDRIGARLLRVRGEEWLWDVQGAGPLTLQRDAIVHGEPVAGGNLVHNGPNGLAGWTRDGRKAFQALDRLLEAEGPDAGITRDLGLHEARELVIELDGGRTPRFRLLVGHTGSEVDSDRVPCVERWGDDLVLHAPDGERQVIVVLPGGAPADRPTLVGLRVTPTEVVLLDGEGEPVGSVPRRERAGSCLTLRCDGTTLLLKRLFVTQGGEAPALRVRVEDVQSFDPGEGLATPEGVLPLEQVIQLVGPAEPAEPDPEAGSLVLQYRDGRRLTGRLEAVRAGALVLRTEWSPDPVVTSCEGLASAVVAEPPDVSTRRASRSVLHTRHGAVAGELAAVRPDGGLVWRPSFSDQELAVEPDSVLSVSVNSRSAFFVARRRFPHALHLRSGETLRCELLRLEGDVLHLRSPLVEDLRVPVRLVKALDLEVRSADRLRGAVEDDGSGDDDQNMFWGNAQPLQRESSGGFDPASLRRALALPRKYKKRGFEHLVLARNGDFLRTSIEGLDGTTLTYPGAQGSLRSLPVERLAVLVWLDPDEEASGPEAADEPSARPPVRVVLDAENRFDLHLTGIEDGVLCGTSPVLGEVRVPVTHLLRIDATPPAEREPSPYAAWVLEPMREPFPDTPPATQEEPAPDAGTGTEDDGR